MKTETEMDISWFRRPNVEENVSASPVETIFEIHIDGSQEDLKAIRDRALSTIVDWHEKHQMSSKDAHRVKVFLENFFQDTQFNMLEYVVEEEPKYVYGFNKKGDRDGLQIDKLPSPTLEDEHQEEITLQIRSPLGIWGYGDGVIDRACIAGKEDQFPLAAAFYNAQHLKQATVLSTNLGLFKAYKRGESEAEKAKREKETSDEIKVIEKKFEEDPNRVFGFNV